VDHLELFNAQLRVLKESDYSRLLLRKLEEQQIEVLAKVAKIIISQNQIPFLPVLPRLAFRFSELMPKIANYPNFGEVTFIKPKQLTDIISVPQEDPYYIFGVDNGLSDINGKSPKQAEEAFKASRRRGLTLVEGLALFMHCGDLPNNYCLWTLNSRLHIGSRTYYVALLIQRRTLQRIYFTPNPDSRVSDFGPNIIPSCQS
jgi:hypothetical protein